MKFLIFLGCVVIGSLLMKYYRFVTNNTMDIGWAEKFFPGGTYTFWKLAGAGLIFFGVWYLIS